jgi:hypothetical protein
MNLTNGQIKGFLFAVEGVGAVFVGLFLTVYLLGLRDLPRDIVYHSEPIFRTSLSIFGVSLIVLVLTAVLLSVLVKKKM